MSSEGLYRDSKVEMTLLSYPRHGELLTPVLEKPTSLVDEERHGVFAILAHEVLGDSWRADLTSSFFVTTKAQDDSSSRLKVGRLKEVLNGSHDGDEGGLRVA